MAELPSGGRVLDLGAGAALLERAVAARGRQDLRFLAFEASLDCMEPLRRHGAAAVVADLETLPALPPGYDAIVAGDVLEHLVRPELLLGKMARALAPGGTLLVSVPNVANAAVRAELLFGRFEYRERGILDRTHRVFFTRRRLRQMLGAAGFEIEDERASVVPLHLVLPRLPRFVLATGTLALGALTRLRPRLFGFQLLARARRRAS